MTNEKYNKAYAMLLFLFLTVLVVFMIYLTKKGNNKMFEQENKLSQIAIGETYVTTGRGTDLVDGKNSYSFIKIIDEDTFLYVDDDTRHTDEYYTGEGPAREIVVEEGTYKKQGDNFILETNISDYSLNFELGIDIEKGTTAMLEDKSSELKVQGRRLHKFAIEKYQGYYRINNETLNGTPSDVLNISEVKLPNSAKEYISQYNLTSGVKPQSYGRAEKKKMFDPAQFPVHREDDGTIWVGF